MTEVVDAALAEHDVVVQILAQTFPKLHRLFVEQRSFGPQVVRAHDGGVATCIAAAYPAFLQNGDIANTVFLREVVRSSETVTTAANNDDIVLFLRLRAAPGFTPVAIVAQCILQQAKG